MKKVIINVDFIDAHTGKVRKAGSKAQMTNERVEEIRAVNPDLITVYGSVEEPQQAGQTTQADQSDTE